MQGWAENAEPDNTYRPLFMSKNAGAGGNRAFYKNPEVDALIDDAATNRDAAKVDEDCKKQGSAGRGDFYFQHACFKRRSLRVIV